MSRKDDVFDYKEKYYILMKDNRILNQFKARNIRTLKSHLTFMRPYLHGRWHKTYKDTWKLPESHILQEVSGHFLKVEG